MRKPPFGLFIPFLSILASASLLSFALGENSSFPTLKDVFPEFAAASGKSQYFTLINSPQYWPYQKFDLKALQANLKPIPGPDPVHGYIQVWQKSPRETYARFTPPQGGSDFWATQSSVEKIEPGRTEGFGIHGPDDQAGALTQRGFNRYVSEYNNQGNITKSTSYYDVSNEIVFQDRWEYWPGGRQVRTHSQAGYRRQFSEDKFVVVSQFTGEGKPVPFPYPKIDAERLAAVCQQFGFQCSPKKDQPGTYIFSRPDSSLSYTLHYEWLGEDGCAAVLSQLKPAGRNEEEALGLPESLTNTIWQNVSDVQRLTVGGRETILTLEASGLTEHSESEKLASALIAALEVDKSFSK